VDKIDDGYAESDLDARQKAIIAWTDAMLSRPAPLDPGIREELARHLTPEQIVELSAGIALFIGFSKIAIALGQAPESMPTLVVPTPSLD
jgi:alkylhydroperoxidase family enzyme